MTSTPTLRLAVPPVVTPIRRPPIPNVYRIAPFEVVVDRIKVYQSENGRNGWICWVYTNESRTTLWWTQALEDFDPLEQERVAALVKQKYGIDIDPL